MHRRTDVPAPLLYVGLLACLVLPMVAFAQEERPRGRERDRERAARRQKPQPATPAAPVTPPPVSSGPRASTALRVECTGLPGSDCDGLRVSAHAAASRYYRVIETGDMEALFEREPALRGCRREDCRVAICDQLHADRLIDVNVYPGRQKQSIAGTVSIYDPWAKGISGDTEIPATRLKNSAQTISEAVDYVISSQRLTASLHLSVKPEGAKIKIDTIERGTARDFKLFLGPHTVRVEKVGFVPIERTVNVTQAGAQLEISLQPQPVSVRFEWNPPEARLLVDRDPVSGKGTAAVDMVEGPHKVQVLAPDGSEFDSRDLDVEVRFGMEPVRIFLPKKSQLRVKWPVGYTLRLDNRVVPGAGGAPQGIFQETLLPTSPGLHQVTAVSWRGLARKASAETYPGQPVLVTIQPPPLAPGLLLAGLGALGVAGGATMLALHGQPSNETGTLVYDFSWQGNSPSLGPPIAGYVTLAVGGAVFIAGATWFIFNAMNHPTFHSPSKERGTRVGRLLFAPTISQTGGAFTVQGGF